MDECKHPIDKIKQEFSGRMWFYAGEVYDNFEPYLVCTVCGQEILPEEYESLVNESAI